MESTPNAKGVRIAGILGVIACAIALAEFPLWFVVGSVPQFWDTTAFSDFATRNSTIYLTRTLMDMFIFSLLIVFFGGFRHLVVIARASLEWIATTLFGLATVYTALTLVSDSLTGSIALDTFGGKADPTVIRALNESTVLMFGSVGLFLMATLLIAAGVLVLLTKVLPRWTGWLALATALWNLAFVPTMYFGTDLTRFYTAPGDGPSAAAPFPFVIWIMATAICMIRKKPIANSERSRCFQL
jgi:hypothetical protein